jgi:hypothetical protein
MPSNPVSLRRRKARREAVLRKMEGMRLAKERKRTERTEVTGLTRLTERVRVTIERTWGTRMVIEAERHEGDEGKWGRWRVKGMRVGAVGKHGLALMVAEAVDSGRSPEPFDKLRAR